MCVIAEPYLTRTEDVFIRRWVDWAIELLGTTQWEARRQVIVEFWDKHELQVVENQANAEAALRCSFIPDDRAAWYIHQCELYLSNPLHCDLGQVGRVAPVVKKLGMGLDTLRAIPDADERMKRGLLFEQDIDSTLFELLTALAYAQQGWAVRFLPETPPGKSPDLFVQRGAIKLYVECKRKRAVSDYARSERARWMLMVEPVKRGLLSARLDWCLDVVFHKPIVELPDNYLATRVVPKLRLARPGVLLDDADITVRAIAADWDRLREAMRNDDIRVDTLRLTYLLFGIYEPWRNHSTVFKMKARPDAPRYARKVDWAAGAVCTCDAPQVITLKASHFRRQLADAIQQLPPRVAGAVHIGAEAYDGEHVELRRYERIWQEMVSDFDFGDRLVDCIYCHLFGFEVPPDEDWALEEKCHPIVREGCEASVLKPTLLIASPGSANTSVQYKPAVASGFYRPDAGKVIPGPARRDRKPEKTGRRT